CGGAHPAAPTIAPPGQSLQKDTSSFAGYLWSRYSLGHERFCCVLLAHTQLFKHGDKNRILVFQVVQDDFDLLLSLDVDLEIVLGAKLGVAALNILAHHDERHQEYLDNIAHEKISHKRREWIERLPAERSYFCCNDVVAAPGDRPEEYHEEKAHGPH